MNINGQEITFDLDDRKDNGKFTKAFNILQKKQNTQGINDSDMEIFLVSCIKSDEVQNLLKDNKISTLVKVFTEFFSQAIDQYGQVMHVYEETADALVALKNKADITFKELDTINNKVEKTK